MKRLNNKGYLLIEVILAGALSMAIGYFLVNLTMKFKGKNDDAIKDTEFLTIKSQITREIMNDVQKYPITSVSTSCDTITIRCIEITYTIKGTTIKKRVSLNIDTKVFEYGIYNTSYLNDENYYKKEMPSELNITNPILQSFTFGNKKLVQMSFDMGNQYLKKGYKVNIIIPY